MVMAGLAVPVAWAMLPQAAQAQGAAVCMTKTSGDSARKGATVAVEVQPSQESALARRGFKRQSCSDVGARARKFRRQMCQVALLKNDQIEAEFAAHYGIRPSEGCPK
jgi:hypothetical protein